MTNNFFWCIALKGTHREDCHETTFWITSPPANPVSMAATSFACVLHTPGPLSFLFLKWTSKTVARNKAGYMIRAVVKEYVMKNSMCERKSVSGESSVWRLPDLSFVVIELTFVVMRIFRHT
jgi:hypothetical protein